MCGIVGIIGTEDLFTKLYRSASKIQHRGTDGVGVVFSDGNHFLEPAPHRVLGEVSQSFNEWPGGYPQKNPLLGLLHIRYGTSGNRKELANTQPFVVRSPSHGTFCLAHNGDTQDVAPIRERLISRGIGFISTSDSEVLAQLIAHCKEDSLPEA